MDKMIDKVYFLHKWAYERQSDGPSDNYIIYQTKEEADFALELIAKNCTGNDTFVREEDGFGFKAGNWEYRYWVDSEPVQHDVHPDSNQVKEEKSLRKLFDEYINAQSQVNELKKELFPRIEIICRISSSFWKDDKIIGLRVGDADEFVDEPTVWVDVDNDKTGHISYFFPLRYLDMATLEIQNDVKKIEEEEKQAMEKDELEKERAEYERLKRKFEELDKGGK